MISVFAGGSLHRAMRHRFAIICACMITISLSACGSIVYRVPVQQGNLVTQESVAQLRAGMTKDQVRFLLGTPLVTDIFHADRWDYVYTLQALRSNAIREERRLTVFFDKDGRLERLEGDVVPKGDKLETPAATGHKPNPTAENQ
jgi:outer membrane protein assembly factor BamE